MSETPLLEISGLGVAYHLNDRHHIVLRDLDLVCRETQIVGVIGESGIGKTTLLKAIAGLLKPFEGSIHVRGRTVTGPGRDRGIVFQHYTIFPWLTVRGNIAFAARKSGMKDAEIEAETSGFLKAIGLERWADLYPGSLSGGMRQRVALARSLAAQPSILLLDEPFGALDQITRLEIQTLVREVFREKQIAILMVTHDVEEAVLVSDRVLLLGGHPAKIITDRTVHKPREATSAVELCPEDSALAQELICLLRQNRSDWNLS